MLGQPLRTMAALAAGMLAMSTWPCSNAELTSVHHLQQAELVYKEFTSFQQQFNRSYLSEQEYHSRLTIFRSNYETILTHNAAADRGEKTFWLKITPFMDRTVEEYQQYLTNVTASSQVLDAANLNVQSSVSALQLELPPYDSAYTPNKLPAHVDWRLKGVAGPIRDQGQCGACWAFATVNSVAGLRAWKTGQPFENLSVQQLVDCAKASDGTAMTCATGGEMSMGIDWLVSQNVSLVPERDYAYTAVDGTCKLSSMQSTASTTGAVAVQGYRSVASGDEHALKVAIFQRPMVSVAMDASPSDFMLYSHGVWTSTQCKNDEASLDHAVTLTGYGTDADGKSWWLVKNSWGDSWGESGYFRIARNAGNMCGIATDATYPLM